MDHVHIKKATTRLEVLSTLETDSRAAHRPQFSSSIHLLFSHILTPTNPSPLHPYTLIFEIFANILKGMLAKVSSSSFRVSDMCALF
jgi:hypothetical protein